jgi:tetratricopeptide (TPR) repeat protein
VNYLNRLARSSARDWDLKRELAGAYLRIGRVQGGVASANIGDSAGAMASFVSAGKLLDEVLRHSPEDRQATLDRLEVYTEIAALQIMSQQPKDIGALAQAGLPLAQALLRTNPNDLEAIHYAGLLHLRLASFNQHKGNVSGALAEAVAARQLLERYAQSKPYDRAAQEGLSDADNMVGAEQLHLGHTKEGLASVRSAAAVLEAVSSRYPNDTSLRRYLIQAYYGISQTLGSAIYPDLLDPQGAFEAGRKMVEEAKFVYDADPADVEALSDYGSAMMYLGQVTPPHGSAQRKTFELSETLLTRAALRNPQSRTVMGSKTELEYQLAELCRADGRRAEAMRYYQMAISTGEKAMASDPNYFPTLTRFLRAVRAMAQIQAQQGARAEALATLDRLLRAADRADAGAKPTDVILHVVIARSWQTAGSVYATLSSHETGGQAGQDRVAARAWYQRALDQWRKLEPQPGFSAGFRKEMQAAEQALAPGVLDRSAQAPVRVK